MKKSNIGVGIIDELIELSEELTYRLLLNKSNKKLKEKYLWLDNEDLCKLLKCDKKHLENLRLRGKIAYHKLNRKVYYTESDLNEYFINQKKDAKNGSARKPNTRRKSFIFDRGN